MQIDFLQIADMEKHQRLKIARARKFETAKEAALSLGVPYGTYSGHEAGSRGFKEEEAELYARRYRVQLPWLTFGIGTMAADDLTSELRIAGRVGAGARIDVIVEQAPSNSEVIEVKLELPAGAIGFEVSGDSMYPKYEDGDIIVCMEAGVELQEIPDGAEAAVRTIDGDRYLKKLVRTDAEGVFNLESHNAPVIRGVKIEWASDVVAIIPKRKWRALTPADRHILVGKTKKKVS